MKPHLAATLAACLACGCPSDEAEEIANAIETFIDFGMSNEERAKAPSKVKRTPHLHERSREVVEAAPGGPLLHVVVELPHDLGSEDVSTALEIELGRFIVETPYPRIKLEALATGLQQFGGPMGRGEARKGPKGIYETKVHSFINDKQPALTDDQLRSLVDFELAVARSGNEARARALITERHGKTLLDSAIRTAKRRYRSNMRGR